LIRETTAMETVVTSCGGCGKAIRIRRPDVDRRRACPVCSTPIFVPGREPVAPASIDAPAVRHAKRRRAVVGALGLLEMTGLLAVAAPVAVWCSAAWTSAASQSVATRPEFRPASIVREDRTAARREPAEAVKSDPAPIPPDARPATPSATVWPEALRGLATRVGGALDADSMLPGPLAGLLAVSRPSIEPDEPGDPPGPATPPLLTPPDFGAPSSEVLAAACTARDERRFLIRSEDGRQVVARLHGHREGESVLMLPDGRLGVPSMLVPTDEPFVPTPAEDVARNLQATEFAGFGLHRTDHYVILHQSADDGFARSTGKLLEDLYQRLLEAFRKHDVPVHEVEFPLVAVIFRTEDEFRAFRPVAHDVQAYYEISSNRIFLYDQPSGGRAGPEIDSLLKPQMVAHEGTHQILQNIGVHPRLSEWPLWLVEGLAEYCATPSSSRKGGPAWDGLGQINNLHMATLREIEDPVSLAMRGGDAQTKSLFRKPGQPLVEAMIRRAELTPTEYALAWAITHYLAMKRSDDFTRFLRSMADIPPLEPRTPDDHVREFRKAFGDDLGKLDKTIHTYLNRLTKQKGYDPMPYYAVLFEQPLPNGQLRRAAMVSQSPQLIKQWVDEISNPAAGLPSWQASPYPSRGRATLAVQEWIQSN